MTGRDTPAADPHAAKPKGFDDFDLTLGDLMRGERATLGKSLLDVQRDIKIKAEYLAAIEDADLSAFETPGFISGYVRSYARYLGMNQDWVYRRFCVESGFSHVGGLDAQVYTSKPPKPRRQAAAPASSSVGDAILARSPIYAASRRGGLGGVRPGAVGSLAVLLSLSGGLGYGGWILLQEIQRVQVTPVETALTTAPEAEQTAAATMPGNAAPTPEALERLYRPRPLDRPILTPRDVPIAMLDPDSQGLYAGYRPALEVAIAPPPPLPSMPGSVPPESGPDGTVTAEASAAATAVAQPLPPLTLIAAEPSWVRVRAADGSILAEKILTPDAPYALPDLDVAPTLRAGNSGALYFLVGGEMLGPAGPAGAVVDGIGLAPDALRADFAPVALDTAPELLRLAEAAGRPAAASSVAAAVAAAIAAPSAAPAEALQDAPDGSPVQVVEGTPPDVMLFARRPSWVRVRAADGTVLFEKILEPGEAYVLPATEAPPILRAGNSGSLFFAINGTPFGPAGVGTSVAKDVVLSPEALQTAYAPADLGADPELARIAELVLDDAGAPAGSD